MTIALQESCPPAEWSRRRLFVALCGRGMDRAHRAVDLVAGEFPGLGFAVELALAEGALDHADPERLCEGAALIMVTSPDGTRTDAIRPSLTSTRGEFARHVRQAARRIAQAHRVGKGARRTRKTGTG